MKDDYRADDGEIESSGYSIEDAPEDAGMDAYDGMDAMDSDEDDDDDVFPDFSGDLDMEEE